VIGPYGGQDLWHEQATGNDADGQKTFADPVKFKGRWVEKMKRVVNQTGAEVIASIQVLVPSSITVAPGDRLSDDETAFHEVVAVEGATGLEGAVRWRLAYCGR